MGGYVSSDEAEGGSSDEGDSGESGGDDADPSAARPVPSIIPPTSPSPPTKVRLWARPGPPRKKHKWERNKVLCALGFKGHYVRLAQHYESKKHGLTLHRTSRPKGLYQPKQRTDTFAGGAP